MAVLWEDIPRAAVRELKPSSVIHTNNDTYVNDDACRLPTHSVAVHVSYQQLESHLVTLEQADRLLSMIDLLSSTSDA